jgi:aminoglycoside phosphotransferase (APT) family kinase protein
MTASCPADVDADRLTEYLRGRVEGFERRATVRRLQGGQSNPTYHVSAGGREYVLRTKPAAAALLLPSAHQIEREYRVIRALATTEVPVPTAHLLCTNEEVIGRAFYVMDFVPGRVYLDPRLPGLSSAERSAIFEEMNRVIAALHRVDWQALGLADYGKPGDYLARQIARWSRQYRASETETIDAMDRLIEWLPGALPPDEGTALVHGDFRLDNLIFDAHTARVTAVIDWELSTLGSPLADFAYHCCVWHFPAGLYRGLAGVACPEGIPSEADYRDRYAERTGRAVLDHWDYFLAYNFFRMAAIMQGILKRAQDGTAAAADAVEFGRGARRLAEAGWSRVERMLRSGSGR